MKYTPEITEKLKTDYLELEKTVEEIAEELLIPKRSVIAKLSSLGIYKRKPYIDKTGKPPIKKSEYIESISKSLNMPVDTLDSLEKVNKHILHIIDQRLKPDPKPEQVVKM